MPDEYSLERLMLHRVGNIEHIACVFYLQVTPQKGKKVAAPAQG